MGNISPDAVLRRGPRVAYRELGGDRGAVLLRLDTGAYHGIDRVGVLVWDLLEGSPSFGELISGLESRLVGIPTTLEREITDFLTGLRDRGLIEVVDPTVT
jgi:hypothetical protein